MRRAVAIVVAACAVATAIGPAGADAAPAARTAAAQCTYTPELPKLIVVNKPTLNFDTPVRITAAAGIDCTSNFGAAEPLVHGADSYFLSWLYNSTTASDAIYATTVVPGTYATTAKGRSCSVTSPADGSHPTCAVESGTTVMKFGGRAGLSATRLTGSKSDEVRFTARTTRFDPSSTSYVRTTMAIQRYANRAWHTIYSALANGSHGFVFTYTDSHPAQYRAVSTATSAVTAAVSGTVTR